MKNMYTDAQVYRSMSTSVAVAGGSLLFGGLMAFFAANSLDNTLAFAIAVIGLLLAGWGALRVARCGVFIEESGVRVLNPLSTVHLQWSEIAQFELSSYGACLIKRVHGRSVGIVGIQQTAWDARRGKRDTDEAKMIAELNTLLDQHRTLK